MGTGQSEADCGVHPERREDYRVSNKESFQKQELVTNFISDKRPAWYSTLYRKEELPGGHVIMLGQDQANQEAAIEAVKAWPGGLQVGGGIHPNNAEQYLEAGASHVIVTSYIFHNGQLDPSRLQELVSAVGSDRIVLDLSCRFRDGVYWVVTDRWQHFSELCVNRSTLESLSASCQEFLVHGVDVEGKRCGVDKDLIQLLGSCSPLPVTYAGGVKDMSDLELVAAEGNGLVDVTVGSALDIFGGDLPFSEVLTWHRQHTVVGGYAGVIETCINQPLLCLKNILQEGRALPINPVHYYRGLPLNAMMMAPVTAIQFGANAACRSSVQHWTGKEVSTVGTFLSAAVAGGLSATVASPAELVILQQQKSGKSLTEQIRSLLRTHGLISFTRGLGMCIGRESVYASGYLGVFPIMYSWLQSSSLAESYSANALFLSSGVVSGVFAAYLSQPFDTVKTRQQAFLYSDPAYLTAWKGIQQMQEKEGFSIFWKGAIPRGVRIIAAVFILNEVKSRATKSLERNREPNHTSWLT